MSEKSKDERLIELMTEYLQTSNKKADQSTVRQAYPELDNEQTQELVKSLRSEVDLLKDQLQGIRKKIHAQNQNENYSSTGVEVTGLQNSIADQSTKLGDLEYKVKMLKADVESKKAPKAKKGFGWWGWGLLCSNILLWSVLGWFIWRHYNGGFANEKLLAANANSNKEQDLFIRKVDDVEPSDSSLIDEFTDEEIDTNMVVSNAQNDSAINAGQTSENRLTNRQAVTAAVPAQSGVSQVAEQAAVTAPVAQNKAVEQIQKETPAKKAIKTKAAEQSEEKKELTQAEIWFLRQAEEKKAMEELNRSGNNTGGNNQTENNRSNKNTKPEVEPAVRFGD